jgi:hypothetical protein
MQKISAVVSILLITAEIFYDLFALLYYKNLSISYNISNAKLAIPILEYPPS